MLEKTTLRRERYRRESGNILSSIQSAIGGVKHDVGKPALIKFAKAVRIVNKSKSGEENYKNNIFKPGLFWADKGVIAAKNRDVRKSILFKRQQR